MQVRNVETRHLLESIKSPADLRGLDPEQLTALAGEIRAELLDVVFARGGHLASNLGAVELTIALLCAFEPPTDKIVWDTGHQGYVYKLLTGRRELFQKLRQDDGCCGFLHRDESKYDVFGAGHAGTAISAAVGMAVERDRRHGEEHVLAVIGDGAIASGVALEGLNNIIEATDDLMIVLNDNKMSIAPNVGAISRNLNRIISGQPYNRLKDFTARALEGIPVVGKALRKRVRQIEEAAKGMIVPGMIFEELGLRYIGPLDGHDIEGMVETFDNLKQLRQPLLVHVLTEKGHGYPEAVLEPERYHGVSRPKLAADVQPGSNHKDKTPAVSFSTAAGNAVENLLRTDPAAIAITAGMCKGTGLESVRDEFSDRFFDVGIAEEHAVVFAAGMAATGLHPVVAIYATFMQRAMDYVFHDVCLQNLPVIFCLDRAGIVADGPTHHGIHDLAFWRSLPNLAVCQPADADELAKMMELAALTGCPSIIRYPRGEGTNLSGVDADTVEWGKAGVVREGRDVALWCLGRETATGMRVADLLAEDSINARVVNARFIKPFDRDYLAECARQMPIVTIEDHAVTGGMASTVHELLPTETAPRVRSFGWPDQVVPWGSDEGIRRKHGMTADQIADEIRSFLGST